MVILHWERFPLMSLTEDYFWSCFSSFFHTLHILPLVSRNTLRHPLLRFLCCTLTFCLSSCTPLLLSPFFCPFSLFQSPLKGTWMERGTAVVLSRLIGWYSSLNKGQRCLKNPLFLAGFRVAAPLSQSRTFNGPPQKRLTYVLYKTWILVI